MMTKAKSKYRSEIAAAVHDGMSALHRVGAVGDDTMRGFDRSCLIAEPPVACDRIPVAGDHLCPKRNKHLKPPAPRCLNSYLSGVLIGCLLCWGLIQLKEKRARRGRGTANSQTIGAIPAGVFSNPGLSQ